jgi:hypothetical protein
MGKYALILCLICFGCLKPKDNGPAPQRPAPDGNTFQSDMNGILHPTFVVVGVATELTAVEVDAGSNEFRGVGFDMVAGATPQITVVGQLGVSYRAFIYGPQSVQGLWGRALYELTGVDTLVISTWEAPQSGHYLLLAVPNPGRTFKYTVSIECEGCELDRCQAETPCNNYCPQGRAIDATSGCTTCECAGSSCVTEGCSVENEVCVFRCGEDSCAAGQTCMRGRCLDSTCEMECGADEACFEGVCQLARYECAAVTAICEESCPPLREPVCAEIDGRSRTVPNRCLAECLEADNIESGECESTGCQERLDCPAGEQCESGMCVPDPGCGCDSEPDMPVCGESMATRKTFRNRCEMNCADHQLEYEGVCIDEQRCDTSLDCRVSERCIALPDARIAGNESRCESAGDSVACIRACIGRQRCRDDAQCSFGSICLLGPEGGLCMPTCGGERGCESGERCSTKLRDPLGMSIGVCLTACDTDNVCHNSEICAPGENVCLPCDSCALSPEMPICYGGEVYSNGCELLCEGHTRAASLPTPATDIEIETCNGLDDDCDGQIDEDLVRACESDTPQCREGQQSCTAGAWSECEPVSNQMIELCNQIDDDCDGQIDEAPILLSAGESECNPQQDCASCPTTWSPVCTDRGIAPNQCLAECEGLAVKMFSDCGLRQAPVSRCEFDDECMPSRCITSGQSVCGGAELNRVCAQYNSSGACFERTADCRCNRDSGTCGFMPTIETFQCLERMLIN